MKKYLRVRLKNDVGKLGVRFPPETNIMFCADETMYACEWERGASCNTLVLNNFHTWQHDETWHICHFNPV